MKTHSLLRVDRCSSTTNDLKQLRNAISPSLKWYKVFFHYWDLLGGTGTMIVEHFKRGYGRTTMKDALRNMPLWYYLHCISSQLQRYLEVFISCSMVCPLLSTQISSCWLVMTQSGHGICPAPVGCCWCCCRHASLHLVIGPSHPQPFWLGLDCKLLRLLPHFILEYQSIRQGTCFTVVVLNLGMLIIQLSVAVFLLAGFADAALLLFNVFM